MQGQDFLANVFNLAGNPGDYVFSQQRLDEIITQRNILPD